MRFVYVVFSATQTQMGRWIRKMTGGHYNHVSVSFSPCLGELFSFARVYRETPLCGGFVCESYRRYLESGATKIAVCRVPVRENAYRRIRARILKMRRDEGQYIYNYLSAGAAYFHRHLSLPNAYTCVEFVSELLRFAALPLTCGYVSVDGLFEMLSRFIVYRGNALCYPAATLWGRDRYASSPSAAAVTAETMARLFSLAERGAAAALSGLASGVKKIDFFEKRT